MAQYDCKQISAVTRQRQSNNLQHSQTSLPTSSIHYDQRLLLIRCVKKHPRLYKNEYLQRQERQRAWDAIAKASGFRKTEDAKCKWRSLIGYLRQHLDCVAQKKQRRYIPNTGNPDDQYIQLNDWKYYKEIEFAVPYVKNVGNKPDVNLHGNRMNPMPSETAPIAVLSDEDNIEEMNGNQQREQNKQENFDVTNNPIFLMKFANVDTKEQNLTEEDEILREFFDNMLKSTLNLPRFHQNRIREKLTQAVNMQKVV